MACMIAIAVHASGCVDRAASFSPGEMPAQSTTAAEPAGSDDRGGSTAAPEPSVPSCDRASSEGLSRCVDQAALESDIRFIADLRVPGSPHWLATQELCADRLAMLGFEVEFHDYGTGTNVIGRRFGTTEPDRLVMVGAHYDHIEGCNGADDNASGVGGALEVARILAEVPTARTLAVACWDQEEVGLIGSLSWLSAGVRSGETIEAYFNYDMIGIRRTEPDTQQIPPGLDLAFPDQYAEVQANDFRGDFIVLVADDLAADPAAAFEAHASTLELRNIVLMLDAQAKNSPLFSDLRRSDHAGFWLRDAPALFFTDTAELRHPNYHCIGAPDDADALDYAFAAQVVGATVGAMADTLVLQ